MELIFFFDLFQLFMELPWVFFQEVNDFLKLKYWAACHNLVKVFPSPLAKKNKKYSFFCPLPARHFCITAPYRPFSISTAAGTAATAVGAELRFLPVKPTDPEVCTTLNWDMGLFCCSLPFRRVAETQKHPDCLDADYLDAVLNPNGIWNIVSIL